MKKSIVATISNIIFLFLTSFFLVSYLSNKILFYPANLFLGLYVSLIVLVISIAVAKRKRFNLKQKRQEENEITRIVYSLSFMSKKKGLEHFYSIIKKRDEKAKLYSNRIVLKNGDCIYNLFSFAPVTKADLVKCFNQSGTNKSIILCESAPLEVKEFSQSFRGKIVIKEKAEVFKTYPAREFIIKDKFTPIDFNKKDKPKLKALLNKKNAKKLLAFGVLFLATSFFVPIKVYYIIIGSVMLLFASSVLIFSRT